MKISASDWAAISEHFDRLADLPAGQRRQELASLDIGAERRQQLLRLLEQHDRADSLGLDTAAPERLGLDRETAELEQVALPDWQGQRLGPWQVDEVIGRGGMSVIYRAHRADGQFEKEVAIKVLNKANLIGDGKRLEEETRILARLEHPGIARLIDSGTSDAGHGYLVMELVQGQALDTYCRAQAPSTETIVHLVIAAARALEYAHQRQVVHCDIKPANLLVRENGRLCVVDFGIAALLQRRSETAGRLYCSPAYTAPERFRRAPPDTRQDVFSLGAVLRELLADRADRDLTAVCSKATAAAPDARYAGMTDFRSELEAWQQKRPVAARGGARAYLFARWLQRHALAATMGTMLILSLSAGIAAALWQAREARSEAARAIAVRDFLVGIFESADPALMRGEDPPASELLRRGAERVRSAMAAQPRLLAELLQVIGRTQLERGLITDAEASLDKVLSLEETRRLPGVRVDTLSDRGMVAYEQGQFGAAVRFLESARELAAEQGIDGARMDRVELRLADMLLIDGQPERALAVIEQVLERLPDTSRGEAGSVLAEALRVQGAALHEAGRLDLAQRVLERALALQQALDDDDILLAKIENDLGIVYWDRRELDAAAEVFERSLLHKRKTFGDDHPQTISTLGNLAGVNMVRGDHAGAESAWLQSLDALQRVHDNPHPDIAYTWGMLAWSHYMRDDFQGALELVDKGLDHRDELAERELAMLAWLKPLQGLLKLELGQPVDVDDLTQSPDACQNLSDASELRQRMCLAWRLLESDSPSGCGVESIPVASPDLLAALPARWRAVHLLLRARCSPDEADAIVPADDASAPDWLRRRIRDHAPPGVPASGP